MARKSAVQSEAGDAPVPAKTGLVKPDLTALLGAGKMHEDEERQGAGRDKSYVQIVKEAEDKVLREGKPEYIKGAKYKGFIIPNKKIWLGMEPEVVIVGMFKVYEERIPVPPGSKELPALVGIWMPQDAEQIPLGDGQFDRPFRSSRDGKMHVLNPAHWVSVWFRKHPDIDDAVITFRSVGNSIYQQLVKLIKQSGVASAPQLKVKLTTQIKEAKNYNDKAYLYPDFEILEGLNFDINEKTGAPKLVEGGLTYEELEKVLTLYGSLAKDYASNNMVSLKTDIAKLIAPPDDGALRQVGQGKGTKPVSEDSVNF